MKYTNILCISMLAASALTGCISEDLPADKTDEGKMVLDVELLKPQSTRADINTSEFPINIYANDGSVVKSYDRLSLVPTAVLLPVGNYTAEAHTPGQMQKIMATPYYLGTEPFIIMKDKNTRAEVTCKMANGNFTIRYADSFTSSFASWDITIDDGGESALHFSNADGLTPATVYMAFEDNTDKLTVNFKGKTVSGNSISTSNILTKKNASEQYDRDDANFAGGDAIVINFNPVASSEGQITDITINADIRFEEYEEWVDMEVEDKGGQTPDQPDQPDQPGDKGDITLSLPAPISFPVFGAAGVDKSLGDTYIAATAGLKSLTVSIVSTSEDMNSSLADLAGEYGVDFIAGAEIVDNQSVVALFNSLGQTLSVPAQGDKEYNFPIGNFFDFLMVLPGEHTFNLTVTDMNGDTKSGSVVVTITE